MDIVVEALSQQTLRLLVLDDSHEDDEDDDEEDTDGDMPGLVSRYDAHADDIRDENSVDSDRPRLIADPHYAEDDTDDSLPELLDRVGLHQDGDHISIMPALQSRHYSIFDSSEETFVFRGDTDSDDGWSMKEEESSSNDDDDDNSAAAFYASQYTVRLLEHGRDLHNDFILKSEGLTEVTGSNDEKLPAAGHVLPRTKGDPTRYNDRDYGTIPVVERIHPVRVVRGGGGGSSFPGPWDFVPRARQDASSSTDSGRMPELEDRRREPPPPALLVQLRRNLIRQVDGESEDADFSVGSLPDLMLITDRDRRRRRRRGRGVPRRPPVAARANIQVLPSGRRTSLVSNGRVSVRARPLLPDPDRLPAANGDTANAVEEID